MRYTSQNDTHLEWNPGSEVKYYGTSFDVITLEDKENNGKKVYQGLLAEPVDEQKREQIRNRPDDDSTGYYSIE